MDGGESGYLVDIVEVKKLDEMKLKVEGWRLKVRCFVCISNSPDPDHGLKQIQYNLGTI